MQLQLLDKEKDMDEDYDEYYPGWFQDPDDEGGRQDGY